MNAAKKQFDQNSKLRQEYEALVAKVDVHEMNVTTMQNMLESKGFSPDKAVAELEVQAMNIAALKSEIAEMSKGCWQSPGLNSNDATLEPNAVHTGGATQASNPDYGQGSSPCGLTASAPNTGHVQQRPCYNPNSGYGKGGMYMTSPVSGAVRGM